MSWIWLVVGLVVLFLIFRGFRGGSKPKIDFSPEVPQVSGEEAKLLASDIRELAFTGYDRASSKALNDGQSERFSHEIGVLDAGFCVLANKAELRADDSVRQSLQMELVPFNLLRQELGKKAVAEFLVWKFFPSHADKQILNQAFDKFVEGFLAGGKSEPPSDQEIQQFIYSGRYSWQPLAQEAIARRV